jgi:hypothetical protein
MAETRSSRIARLRDELKRKRSRLQRMELTREHFAELRKDEVEAAIRTLTEEISVAAEELHQLEVQLIRESLQG